jgi:hypothetical protein
MNISLSDNNAAAVTRYLANPDSGYQQLAEAIYWNLKWTPLQGIAVPLDNINMSVMTLHSTRTPIVQTGSIDPDLLRQALFTRWKEKNSSARATAFNQILDN